MDTCCLHASSEKDKNLRLTICQRDREEMFSAIQDSLVRKLMLNEAASRDCAAYCVRIHWLN